MHLYQWITIKNVLMMSQAQWNQLDTCFYIFHCWKADTYALELSSISLIKLKMAHLQISWLIGYIARCYDHYAHRPKNMLHREIFCDLLFWFSFSLWDQRFWCSSGSLSIFTIIFNLTNWYCCDISEMVWDHGRWISYW